MHSTFFGPIKYAILPQHLQDDEVLSGTGWVEAGTYIAILGGTIAGGLIAPHHAIVGIVAVAVVGRLTASLVPPAPPEAEARDLVIDHNVSIGRATCRERVCQSEKIMGVSVTLKKKNT